MKKAERREYILKTAEKMAKSGKYKDYMRIEIALRSDGFPEARQVLDDHYIRQELDELCEKAQSKGTDKT